MLHPTDSVDGTAAPVPLASRIFTRFGDRKFWAVQVLVLAIAVMHTGLEARGTSHHFSTLYLLPISTYFIPTLYAAVNFGVEGAVPTGLWCIVLTIPNMFLFHRGSERIGVATQLALLLILGSVVAQRVDRERRSKHGAEAANRRLGEIQESLKSYIGMAMSAQEEERSRLARELHDETIQDLLVIKGDLESMWVGSGESSLFEVIDRSLQGCIQDVRRLCRALRPSVLDDLGLIPAVELLLTDTRARANIQTDLRLQGETFRLDPDPELAIFRIAQEALRNVERHSHATHVEVRLEHRPDKVLLEITDDGDGFHHDLRCRGEGGLGLVVMKERAALIGAQLRIRGLPGGTRVSLLLPIENQVLHPTPAATHDL